MPRKIPLQMIAFIAFIVASAVASECVAETPSTQSDLESHIAELAKPYVAKRDHCRLTIGVFQDGQRYVASFGADQPPDAKTPDENLVYEIGSITKVFTSILLAQCEQDGLLKLDDPISEHLPKDFTVSPEVGAITFKQLATHTSGLPRLPNNLIATWIDPYAKYGADDLQECLRTLKPNYPPGEKQAYSNLGVALLGYLLAEKKGESFDSLVRSTICEPLGMPDTTTQLSDAQNARLVAGHAPNGTVASNWNFDVMAPAGALRSTVHDLLVFSEANVDGKDGPLRKALDRSQESHYRTKTENTGLGWQILNDPASGLTIHWHNGGTGGYHSFLGTVKSKQLGVVLITNYGDDFAGDSSIDRMGFEILRAAAVGSAEQ
ncbi:MAG: serine hydrolase domain-containing protein [Pirellulales bacterium]